MISRFVEREWVKYRYDRQIHVWGAENQQRIMKSNVLFVSCDYLSCEVHFAFSFVTHSLGLQERCTCRYECNSLRRSLFQQVMCRIMPLFRKMSGRSAFSSARMMLERMYGRISGDVMSRERNVFVNACRNWIPALPWSRSNSVPQKSFRSTPL